ncbi:glycosyltransferase family 32 protein [Limosilactobacillus reuteri]|uniref:glycosyltransferase family 32 protein n=1 Tax=Limosilactobacillus reuteri TaxID=1598 RepID=UPI000E3CBF69|nr:glycosyltransferase [Limosilactobacillus reuteri]
MIPKVIYYCWFGKKKIPLSIKLNLKSWKKYCPDYKIVQINESNFNVSENKFCKKAYEAQMWAFVSDYARLKVINDNGGIYFDTDVELIKKIDNLLDNSAFFSIQQGPKHECATGLGFGSEPNNGLVKEMLMKYKDLTFSLENKDKQTCTIFSTEVLRSHGYKYRNRIIKIDNSLILPPTYMDPFSMGKDSENILTQYTISIHHGDASWQSKSVYTRRKVIRYIQWVMGNKFTNKLMNIFNFR